MHKKLKSIGIVNDKKTVPELESHENMDKDATAAATNEESPKRSEEDTIRSACDIHEELCDACYIAEEYFSVVMLTIVTIGFLIIVFNAYYVLEVTFRQKGEIDPETLSFIIFLVYQMFIHGLGLLCIVQNSSAVFEEVSNIAARTFTDCVCLNTKFRLLGLDGILF